MGLKKLLTAICSILLIVAVQGSVVYANENEEKKNVPKGIILIDPGHGGIDGGAKSDNGTIEKHINLDISKKLRDVLIKEGYKVFLTREEDKSLSSTKIWDLDARCKKKVETKCDVFISVHQNKFRNPRCKGAQVWYASNEKSVRIANLIQNSFKVTVDYSNKRLAKPAQGQYRILRDKYDGACVIVECGFLSNNEEEQALKTEAYQQKVAEAIKLGINKYFEPKE